MKRQLQKSCKNSLKKICKIERYYLSFGSVLGRGLQKSIRGYKEYDEIFTKTW